MTGSGDALIIFYTFAVAFSTIVFLLARVGRQVEK